MPPFRSFLARGASLSAPVQGALYMTVAAFLFALMNGAIRLLGDGWGADGGEGMHPFQIAFLRNLFALAFMLPWLLRHRRGGLATGRLGTHLWRAGLGLTAQIGRPSCRERVVQ